MDTNQSTALERYSSEKKTTGKLSYFLHLVDSHKTELRQILILWDPFQWLTAVQFIWPLIIFLTVYLLRLKFGAYDVDECQFPSRELPSKTTLLPFFQSYICTIENACSSTQNYSEISDFETAP